MNNQDHYDDEINLRDYINVIIKRKKLILAIFFICVITTAIVSFLTPKVYKVSEILSPPILGINDYLDTPQNIKEKIITGTYDFRIIKELNLPPEEFIDFEVFTSKEGMFVEVNIEIVKKKVSLGIEILDNLLKQLSSEYEPILKVKKQEIDNGVFLKLNQIEKKKNEINRLNSSIKLTDERIVSLSEELKITKLNNKKLMSEREVFLKDRGKTDNISPLLYSTTIQQAITQSNRLDDQLNSLKFKKESTKTNIELLNKDIEGIKIEIDNLKIKKGLIQNLKQLQPSQRSVFSVKPKKKLNIIISAVLGLMMGVFIAFFAEFWEKSK